MTLAKLIQSRRSIKTFSDRPVDRELLLDLLDVAVYAPNHRLTERWRFVVVDGAARAELIGHLVSDAASRGKDPVRTAEKLGRVPLFLFVIMKENQDALMRREDFAATSCVVQNFLLLAWEQGLGTHWKTLPETPALRRLVGLADDEQVVGFVQVGYPAEVPESAPAPAARRRRSAREKVTYL